jgi:hypothetical protein
MGIFDFFTKNKKQTEISNREIQILEKPDFSKINYKKLEDYYDWKLKFGKREINLDLNFETELTNQSEFNQIIEFVNRIPEFDNQNRNYIKADFKQDVSMTSDYLNFYLDELDEDELARIIDLRNQKIHLILNKKVIRLLLYTQFPFLHTSMPFLYCNRCISYLLLNL